MNVIFVCPARDIFIDSVDMTGYKMIKEYIEEELKSYIEVVVLNNVTRICSNNISAMLGALDELVALYLHLYKQGYYAQSLEFLLED
jgi:hypothetical protein